MSDPIRRSDALKAVEEGMCTFYDCYVIEKLKEVPSADRPQGDSVSRRYLIAEIDDLADEFSEADENGLHSERWCGIMDAKGVIANAPLEADRPQGEWIADENGGCRCSVCGVREERFVYGLGEYWHGRGESNFCPNCGARMKGADDE